METSQASKPSQTPVKPVKAYEVVERAAGQPKAGSPPRISRKMHKAIRLHVREGTPAYKACDAVGLAEATWYKNMKLPHVVQCLENEKAKYVQEVENLAERHKARALEVAAELLETASSEAVRARMVEFLRGGGKSGVTVNVQNNVNSGGYEYIRPGQRMVEIEGEAEEIQPQTPEGKGN